MQDLLEQDPMAPPKGRPRMSKRDDATTKIDRLLLGKAHLIAKARGVPVAELLSEMVRGQIEKAYGQLLRDLDKQEGKV